MVGRKSALVWCGIIAVLSGFAAYQVTYHWKLQTDVLALLPNEERDPAVLSLQRIASSSLGQAAFFLVGHGEESAAHAATRTLGEWMATNPLFATVQWDYSDTQRAFFDLYFPLRYCVLSPSIRQHLNAPDGSVALVHRLKELLYQPTSSLMTRLLAEDPLLFFPALAQDWGQHATQLQIQDGRLSVRHNGRVYHAITAQLAVDPFAAESQARFETQWSEWLDSLHKTWPELDVVGTSAIRFAAVTQQTILRDIALISIGSALGLILLVLGVFRTLKHLILALLSIAIGVWSAIGISLWLFGSLHTLTLAFGASLIGICDDYSFHYFAYHRVTSPWYALHTMRRLLPALSLGALTTVLSFLGLAFTPLVGLQQIAVFASCGIIVSFGTVIFCFPYLLQEEHPRAHRTPLLYFITRRVFFFWHRFRRALLVSYGAALLLCLPGFWLLRTSDSPHALNALPKDVLSQDHLIRDLMHLPRSQTHLIVEGATAEDVLQKLERLTALLDMQTDHPSVELGPVLTSFLPSLKQQKANLTAVQRLLDQQQFLTQELLQLGFTPETIETFFETLRASDDRLLSPEAWLRHDASLGLRHLWLKSAAAATGPTSILVQVRRVNDRSAFQEILTATDGIHYVDQVTDFTQLFKRYRQQAMWLVAGAYLLILAILICYYGKRGILILLPPLLATFVTVSIFGYLGQPLHLIHTLVLLLILGMGVDFTIFIAESPPDAGPTTLLALTLSALSTILSFGLLSLSGQAVLQAMGLTVLIGITVALVLAPLANNGQPLS
jgi:predicted exporter